MDPEKKDGGGSIMGTIPRKKLPPLPNAHSSSVSTEVKPSAKSSTLSQDGSRPSSSGSLSGSVPRKIRPNLPISRTTSSGSGHASQIPRSSSISSSGSNSKRTSARAPWIEMARQYPVTLRISTKGMPLDVGLPQPRSSRRSIPKRKRPVYQEADETDSDDLMDSDEEARVAPKKRKKEKGASQSEGGGDDVQVAAGKSSPGDVAAATMIDSPPPGTLSTLWYSNEAYLHVFVLERVCGWKTRPAFEVVDDLGHVVPLSTFFSEPAQATSLQQRALLNGDFFSNQYKRMEVSRIAPQKCPIVLALAVEEKNRQLEKEQRHLEANAGLATILAAVASQEQTTTTTLKDTASEGVQPMEVDPVPPTPTPEKSSTVLSSPGIVAITSAAAASDALPETPPKSVAPKNSKDEAPDTVSSTKVEPPTSAIPPRKPRKYFLKAQRREEVLLVKWRGRSHLHCSWERASDIQRLDINSTARNKIRRFYQHQEANYGLDWKEVIEGERSTAAQIRAHGGEGLTEADAEQQADQDDDYFSPQCLEVERILACDENEMNMQVLAKQRALNIRTEQEAVRLRDEGSGQDTKSDSTDWQQGRVDSKDDSDQASRSLHQMIKGLAKTGKGDTPWDPEDNVRYVVKWKGLPFAEMTWEYWRDIKRDAVDEAEDFWRRQRAPDLDEALRASKKAHPHMRDFKKLRESPTYGISSCTRPVADLPDSQGNLSDQGDEDDTDGEPGFKLRSYQLEGVNWLLFNWWNRRSPILADEMGLGKTIQTVAFLRELQTNPATQVRGPFLVVAPLSLVGQWQSEFHSWAPDVNVVLYHGSADARDFLVQQEFYYTDQFIPKPTAVKLKKAHITKFHVLITTYEVVLKDIAVLSKIRWRALIVDEAHRLKNPRAKLFEELLTVPRDYCLLLTGTPIANATEELWALLHFANPEVFDDKDGFLEKFGEMTDAKQVAELHTILKPFLLRRVKDDVEKSLPPKEETILEVSLTPIQKTYYKAIYERNTSFLWKGAKPNNAPSLMNVMMELRKCCNHPYLVKGAEDRILADAAAKLSDVKDQAGNPVPIDQTKLFSDQLVKASGKMVLMEKLLHKLFTDGHKVLIFSQMVRALDLLEELLKLKRYRYERLDGSTSSSSRAHAVDRFNRKSLKRFVMLLSTRAGGLGLNLTAADIVIIFDSDFNPQNDLQAMARAHRIGQTRAVQVFRLLTAKTYEMHMFHSASLKLGLERAVLSQNRDQGDESDDAKTNKSKSDREAQAKEIDELLKKGAYDIFRDDDDKEAEQFMETDIDQLLASSSKKVTYGSTSTSSLGSGLGSFSKASFVANTDEGEKDVDLDDPDFWSKAVGLEAPVETPEEVAAMIDDGVKRSRKQVQVYDPYADTAEAEKLKQERIALEKQLEKEEKERERLEKKMKKQEAKERKKKEREEQKMRQQSLKKAAADAKAAAVAATKNAKNAAAAAAAAAKAERKLEKLERKERKEKLQMLAARPLPLPQTRKPTREPKSKKSKKIDRQRALRRAENEDPILERLKQAWEVPQRAKATAAVIRFGFGRFCKIRHESNLTSLPLQDLETFFRSYIYQLCVQVAVVLLKKLRVNPDADNLRPLFGELLGSGSPLELDWICESVQSAMQMQLDVESRRRFLRMPLILAEPAYVDLLRRGAGLRALRRIGFLVRMNRFIEDCIDMVLSALGHEELGKRGCAANELPNLDVDLKSRYITTEELSLAISSKFRTLKVRAPASWWDRSCDVGLVIGTFVHGLGNYEAIRNDFDLPFAEKVRRVSKLDEPCDASAHLFRVAASAARKVFDDALEAVRIKAELEVQAAVAAAAKAASKREEDAELLRKGGVEAEIVASAMPDTQVENAFEFDGTDTHFVTLPRLHSFVKRAVQKEATTSTLLDSNNLGDQGPEILKAEDDDPQNDEFVSGRIRDHHRLPMPDARVLDHRLMLILRQIEELEYGEEIPDAEDADPDLWAKTDDVLTNIQVRKAEISRFVDDVEDRIGEYTGIGLGGSQCGTSHRTLNDGSDFGFGGASPQLSQVAYGTDAPRFLRAIGVPMNITRFAVSGLVYCESKWMKTLIECENLRNYGEPVSRLPGELHKEKANGPSPLIEAKTQEDAGSVAIMKGQGNGAMTNGNGNTENEVGKTPSSLSDHIDERTERTPEVSSPLPRKVVPVDPVERIPDVFRDNARLRANISVAVLFYGFPSKSERTRTVNPTLWNYHLEQTGSSSSAPPRTLFSDEDFRNIVISIAPDVDVPDARSLRDYVETILLPHCVRLCINGNGPTTRGARGSQGEYETSFGVSLHPEPSERYPSPLPDPCLSLQEHSMEALGQANAMIRRVRLLRSCIYICSGDGIQVDHLRDLAKSKFMGAVYDMPVWWCPWIHDIALVVQASTQGLFHVIPHRLEDIAFSPSAVQRTLQNSVLAKSVPMKIPQEQFNTWAERESRKFPSLFQLERRMAFLSGKATVNVANEARFDCIPMFDHGGWPRN